MEEQSLPHRRGVYLTDKKKSSTWSLPVDFLLDPRTERRHVSACTPTELCLPGQGGATFSIKGQTVNI